MSAIELSRRRARPGSAPDAREQGPNLGPAAAELLACVEDKL